MKECKRQQADEIAMQNTAAENNPRASQGRDLREIRGSDLIVSTVSIGVAGGKQSIRVIRRERRTGGHKRILCRTIEGREKRTIRDTTPQALRAPGPSFDAVNFVPCSNPTRRGR